MIIATIDVGSNSLLLLIASPSPQSSPQRERRSQAEIKIILDTAHVTRLGEGLHQSENLSPAAMERTLQVLKEYKALCEQHHVAKIIAVGTAACRRAKNAGEFLARVKKETGIEVRIISGEEEAQLAYKSVASGKEDLCVVDVGGGSTEIITATESVSLPLGVVDITEKFLHSDPVKEGEIRKAKNVISQIIEDGWRVGPVLRRIADREQRARNAGGHPRDRTHPKKHLIGLAGTCTTLSSLHQGLPKWDPQKIEGSILKLGDIQNLTHELSKRTIAERQKMPGIIVERAEPLLAGALILEALLEKLNTPQIVVSDRGVRYGLYFLFLNSNQLVPILSNSPRSFS